jgi:FkbM family methyltransferase
MLAGRPPRLIVQSIFEPQHYAALLGMVRRYPDFAGLARRYFVGGGSYPYACRIRTPTGTIAPVLHSQHDVVTVHEIFGREDYRAGTEVGVVVDIGSNIGISLLYFLTRNDTSRCYAFEPVPRNVMRLRANLAGYEERYTLQEVAVASFSGEVNFTIEPTGRYGGIGVPGREQISLKARAVSEVLDEILAREDTIDVLKLDTEGLELETLHSIPDEQLSRIRTIYFESRARHNPWPDRFTMQFACETCRLAQNGARPG